MLVIPSAAGNLEQREQKIAPQIFLTVFWFFCKIKQEKLYFWHIKIELA